MASHRESYKGHVIEVTTAPVDEKTFSVTSIVITKNGKRIDYPPRSYRNWQDEKAMAGRAMVHAKLHIDSVVP